MGIGGFYFQPDLDVSSDSAIGSRDYEGPKKDTV